MTGTLAWLPEGLTTTQAARFLRLPVGAVEDAITTGELTVFPRAGGGVLRVDTAVLLRELGVPEPIVAQLRVQWRRRNGLALGRCRRRDVAG